MTSKAKFDKMALSTIEAMQHENILLRERVVAAQRYSQQLEAEIAEIAELISIAIEDGTAAAAMKDLRIQVNEMRAALRKCTQEKAALHIALEQTRSNTEAYVSGLAAQYRNTGRTLQ